MRKYRSYNISDPEVFTDRFFEWLKGTDRVAFLNSNHLDKKYGTYDFVCAVGVASEFICPEKEALSAFKKYFSDVQDWLFGFFSYDLKNELENLTSAHEDGIQMPLIHFFQPRLVFLKKDNTLKIGYISEFYNEHQIDNVFITISKTEICEKEILEKSFLKEMKSSLKETLSFEKL